MRIGTVGLGAMGAPMTRNLATGGDDVICPIGCVFVTCVVNLKAM